MQVTSVNLGAAREITLAGKVELTGIYKEPVAGRVSVTREGLPGDAIVSQKHHGGPDQAVYIYGGEDYAWWSAELGRELPPGIFGENLTIAGLASGRVFVGDRLHSGEVILEITAARIPCSTFAAAMGDAGFARRFRDAERPGFYCRVLREGEIGAGDRVTLEPYGGETATIREVFRNYYDDNADEATTRRLLAAPLAQRARAKQEARLRKLLARSDPG